MELSSRTIAAIAASGVTLLAVGSPLLATVVGIGIIGGLPPMNEIHHGVVALLRLGIDEVAGGRRRDVAEGALQLLRAVQADLDMPALVQVERAEHAVPLVLRGARAFVPIDPA